LAHRAHNPAARFINDPERFARIVEASRKAVRTLAGASVGVGAPHSRARVTPEELSAWCSSHKRRHPHPRRGQTREVEECVAWSGRRPSNGCSKPKRSMNAGGLVHATHATPSELLAVAARRAVVGLCPLTESSLGDGYSRRRPSSRTTAASASAAIPTSCWMPPKSCAPSSTPAPAATRAQCARLGRRRFNRTLPVRRRSRGGRQVLQSGTPGQARAAGLAAGAPLDVSASQPPSGAPGTARR